MPRNPEIQGLRTWIEIDTKAIDHNYKMIRSLLSPGTKYMSIIKSNAYGHSLVDFGAYVSELGADWLGVDSIIEGVALRKMGIKTPILVLGFTLPEMLQHAIEHDVSITVSTFEILRELGKLNTLKKAKVHIKVDTGMHRHGFLANQCEQLVTKLKELGGKIILEGLYTHFADAKNPSFLQNTKNQISEFNTWIDELKKEGIDPLLKHTAAGGGTLLYPESHYDMVRIGAAQYGIWPAPELRAYANGRITLLPALTWKTVVAEVNEIPKGERVGYDFTEMLYRDSVLADCPIGYWHGYPRLLSSVGRVIINGYQARVVGRVSMDIITVDVTDVPGVASGDEVIIIGSAGGHTVTAEDIALLSGTSAYEIITRINPLIKRVYI